MKLTPYEYEFTSHNGKQTSWVRFANNIKESVNNTLSAYFKEYGEYPKSFQVNETCLADLDAL